MIVGFDYETYPIGPDAVIPRPVCLSTFINDRQGQDAADPSYDAETATVATTGDEDLVLTEESLIEAVLEPDGPVGVGHGLGFDLAVYCFNDPLKDGRRFTKVWEALRAGKLLDTGVREKLLDLADTGDLEYAPSPSGKMRKKMETAYYSLGSTVERYLGITSEGKAKVKRGGIVTKGVSDAWRLNYDVLDGVPISEWPDEALEYCVLDAVFPTNVYHKQEERRRALFEEVGHDPLQTQSFRTELYFVLQLLSSAGVAVDAARKEQLQKEVEAELTPEKLKVLIDGGFLVPAQPPRELKIKDHDPTCKRKKGCGCPRKMSKPTKESLKVKKVKEHVLALKRQHPDKIELRVTDKGLQIHAEQTAEGGEEPYSLEGVPCTSCGELSAVVLYCPEKKCDYEHKQARRDVREIPQVCPQCKKSPLHAASISCTKCGGSGWDLPPAKYVSTNADFLEQHKHVDPVLAQLAHRQKLQKLVTTEFPRMEWEGVTAERLYPSFDFLKETGRTSSYASSIVPSFNCQQIDPRVRGCYVAAKGTYLLSVDISQMELCSLAQTLLDLFGQSDMADAINSGKDLHAWLGSDLAYRKDPLFQECCDSEGADREGRYQAFVSLDGCGDKSLQHIYDHFRLMAKPTNLGFPGGLGAATFVDYARATYGVILTVEEAQELKDAWFDTWTEMRRYFQYISTQCQDPRDPDKYAYCTVTGLYRGRTTFCGAANGIGLQSPSAEGALTGLCEVVRHCYDPSIGSILRGNFKPSMFIHDEIIGEVKQEVAHEVAYEVSRVFLEGFRTVVPSVEVKAEPALMLRWNKKAKPVHDESGRLIPWIEE